MMPIMDEYGRYNIKASLIWTIATIVPVITIIFTPDLGGRMQLSVAVLIPLIVRHYSNWLVAKAVNNTLERERKAATKMQEEYYALTRIAGIAVPDRLIPDLVKDRELDSSEPVMPSNETIEDDYPWP